MGRRGKTPTVTFNSHWPTLKAAAEKKGLRVVEWFTRSGVHYQRFSEFEKDSRPLSATYYVRLCRGANMTEADIERESGISYTPEQKEELGFVMWQEAEEDFLRELYDNPKILSAVKQFTSMMKKEDLA